MWSMETTSGVPNERMMLAFIMPCSVGSELHLRELTDLGEQAEPVFQMPGRRHTSTLDSVKVMDSQTDRLAGRSDSKDLATMRARDFRPDGQLPWLLKPLVDRDLEIRKGRDEATNEGLEARRARTLSGGQRDVLPVWCNGLVQKVGVVESEGVVECFHGSALDPQALLKRAECWFVAHGDFLVAACTLPAVQPMDAFWEAGEHLSNK